MNYFEFQALTRCFSSRIVPAGAIAALAFIGPAAAQSFDVARSARCARMGEDFVAVAGTDNCVRIGGHVRVVIANGRAAPIGGAVAARDGVSQASERFHVRPASEGRLLDLFPR
jgi:hypothetical protein